MRTWKEIVEGVRSGVQATGTPGRSRTRSPSAAFSPRGEASRAASLVGADAWQSPGPHWRWHKDELLTSYGLCPILKMARSSQGGPI
jgi:hypothetical protein